MVQSKSPVSAPSSLICLVDVIATNKAAFMERSGIEHAAISSKDGLVKAESTTLRSHCDVGFVTSRKVLMRPFRN